MAQAVFIKVIDIAENYATVDLHAATSSGGKTLMFEVPLEVGRWLQEAGASDVES